MNICPRTLKISASNEQYINADEELLETTETFKEWWFEGKLCNTAEEVADDYFYTFFDKGPYKIIDIEDVSIDW